MNPEGVYDCFVVALYHYNPKVREEFALKAIQHAAEMGNISVVRALSVETALAEPVRKLAETSIETAWENNDIGDIADYLSETNSKVKTHKKNLLIAGVLHDRMSGHGKLAAISALGFEGLRMDREAVDQTREKMKQLFNEKGKAHLAIRAIKGRLKGLEGRRRYRVEIEAVRLAVKEATGESGQILLQLISRDNELCRGSRRFALTEFLKGDLGDRHYEFLLDMANDVDRDECSIRMAEAELRRLAAYIVKKAISEESQMREDADAMFRRLDPSRRIKPRDRMTRNR